MYRVILLALLSGQDIQNAKGWYFEAQKKKQEKEVKPLIIKEIK